MNVEEAVRDAVSWHAAVRSVTLVGSRATGRSTPLSDWDFRLDSGDTASLVRVLPSLAARLQPLAALWDPLSERAVFMLVLAGAVKVDLFPGDERRSLAPPWEPGPSTLGSIDDHFWDWTLWLGGKHLRGEAALVDAELVKMHRHLLAPMGVLHRPVSIEEAVDSYVEARAGRCGEWGVTVPSRLGADVVDALARHGVLPGVA